jgi:uncharacterized RDD family membrane protein YckC
MENGNQTGPYTDVQLIERGVNADTPVLSAGDGGWRSAAELPGLNKYFVDSPLYMNPQYAGFWLRMFSGLLDALICFFTAVTLLTIIDVVLVFAGKPIIKSEDCEAAGVLFFILLTCTAMIVYNAAFEASDIQGTPGKKLCGIVVTSTDGTRIRFDAAVLRNASKLISAFLCCTGFLMIFWQRSKQGLHDQIAKSYVIRRGR